MKAVAKMLVPIVGTLLVVALLFLAQAAGAVPTTSPETPPEIRISYQGTLALQDGTPVSDTVTMDFALYDSATGENLLWGPETQSVEVGDGLFHVLLGSVSTISPADLAGNLYLDISVNGEELVPREQLASSVVTSLAVSGEDTSFIGGDLQVGSNSWTPEYAGMDGNDLAVLGTLEQYGQGGTRVYKLGVGTDPPAGEGNLKTLGEVIVGGNGTSMVEGDLQVGGNGWTPEYADMDGNDFAVLGTLEQDGQGGARVYRLGVGTDPGPGEGTLKMGGNINMNGHTVSNCGALTEANLQTPEERAAERNFRFEEGDVLCWAVERLEKCATVRDMLVQAVADADGRPIVLGAEAIKVLGPVKVGDYLVSSGVPGYAMAAPAPAFGIVIAQALEGFEGERGLIKAMIRKM